MNFFTKIFSKPLTSTLKITSSNGFHLRPIAKFVSVAKTFPCDIHTSFNNKTVSAKAINALLSLGLEKKDTFTLTTQGKDAQKALDSLQATFTQLMHDEVEVPTPTQTSHTYISDTLQGESIYAGIGIAPLYLYTPEERYVANNTTLKEAISLSLSHLKKQQENATHNADIFLAQHALLSQLASESTSLETFSSHIHKEIEKLKGTVLESKNIDYLDLLQLVKSKLGYIQDMPLPAEPFILVADDLLPSQIDILVESSVLGVILKKSALTSHTAILLRSSGIPSLLLQQDFTLPTYDVILDCYAGVLVLSASEEDVAQATRLQKRKQQEINISYKKRFEPTTTKTGKCIKVYANVTDVTSATQAKEEGAEGIGLLRTEFLFTNIKPTLEEQVKAYTNIFTLFDDITVRTLDVGGDKALPYLTLPKEANPFLGVRGIRLLQTHPKLIEDQLLAIFKASQNKPIKVMFPMISSVEEFSHAKTFARHVATEHKLDISHILFGMMLEVPSVLFALDAFNEVVDFYSVGTNDLTQYLFAIERTHSTLKTDALSPIVFTVLEHIAKKVSKPLSICGELASNPQAIEKLVSLGYTTLSMTSKQIASSKEIIRHV